MLPVLDLGFVVGPTNAADLVRVPDTRWLIASGMIGPGQPRGHLFAVDTVARSAQAIYPAGTQHRPLAAPYDDVPPPEPDAFNAHGLALRHGGAGVHTLYVVNHGGREAIEVFEVEVSETAPTVTWVGAVLQAPRVCGNSVAALPDGGILATNYRDLDDAEAPAKICAGEVSGNLKEWHAGQGWRDVPGSECNAPNGVAVSADGAWCFAASWATRQIIRISRDGSRERRESVAVDFLPDNLKWNGDGRLITTGQVAEPAEVFAAVDVQAICTYPFVGIEIDPDTMVARRLFDGRHEQFGLASTALDVDGETWIASPRADRIAYLARPADSD